MSGHSKWATTKHQKAATDAKRSNLFTKLANNISVAARSGGDPTMNFSLRISIDKAKAANMPKDKIERAIKRGTGELGGARAEDITYEIYGPHGTAVILEAFTDNKNRTAGEVKAILNKLGGKLAGNGAVAFLFERKGELKVKNSSAAELAIINSGAEDYEEIEGGFLVYCKPEQLKTVMDNLKNEKVEIESFNLVWEPKTTVIVSEENSQKVINFLETLDSLDDVTAVSSNLG
jgi:YebC/PmpR family DNA-binding regulatory protein